MTDAQRAVLEGWVRRRTTAQTLAQRSRIVLECAEGYSIIELLRDGHRSGDCLRAATSEAPGLLIEMSDVS
ncbi:hypothetical protein ACWEV9_34450, partial [Streptomyces albogriseolus]